MFMLFLALLLVSRVSSEEEEEIFTTLRTTPRPIEINNTTETSHTIPPNTTDSIKTNTSQSITSQTDSMLNLTTTSPTDTSIIPTTEEQEIIEPPNPFLTPRPTSTSTIRVTEEEEFTREVSTTSFKNMITTLFDITTEKTTLSRPRVPLNTNIIEETSIFSDIPILNTIFTEVKYWATIAAVVGVFILLGIIFCCCKK